MTHLLWLGAVLCVVLLSATIGGIALSFAILSTPAAVGVVILAEAAYACVALPLLVGVDS